MSVGYTGFGRFPGAGAGAHDAILSQGLHLPGVLSHLQPARSHRADAGRHHLRRAASPDPRDAAPGLSRLQPDLPQPLAGAGQHPLCARPAQLQSFLRRIEQYLEFFMTEIGGRAATPFEIKERALRIAAASSPSTAAGWRQRARDSGRVAGLRLSRRGPGRAVQAQCRSPWSYREAGHRVRTGHSARQNQTPRTGAVPQVDWRCTAIIAPKLRASTCGRHGAKLPSGRASGLRRWTT